MVGTANDCGRRTDPLSVESNHSRNSVLPISVCLPTIPELPLPFAPLWGIENSLHWTLDVTFSEDDCRVRSLHAPHNLALLRRFAVNTFNREPSFKRSLKQKSKRAAMDDAYMLTLLAAALPVPNQQLQPFNSV